MGSTRVTPCFESRAEESAASGQVLRDIRALERMLARGQIEAAERIGAEQEMHLVDATGEPACVARQVLARLPGGPFTHELALFNIEANLTPHELTGPALRHLEDEALSLVHRAATAARGLRAHVVLCGLLPSTERGHLESASMTPSARFEALQRATLLATGGDVHVAIRGRDDLELRLPSLMLEACATSFQVHLQVAADAFAATYNAAQVALAAALAVGANSPLLLGKRLWHETRIPLIEMAAAFKGRPAERRGQPARASFGTRWVTRGPAELFLEDLVRHRPQLRPVSAEDPFERLARGGTPALEALTVHNGTVLRWNRPCYGVDGDVAHLRIECRALPAGPTVVDQMATAALWLGLTRALPHELGDIARLLPFEEARANFYAAARDGIEARLRWIDGKEHLASELIGSRLLPLARRGLAQAGVDAADVARLLEIIEARCALRRTGATWMLEAFESLQDLTPTERGPVLTRELAERRADSGPVHAWEPMRAHATVRPRPGLSGEVPCTLRPEDPVEVGTAALEWSGWPLLPVEDADGHVLGVFTGPAVAGDGATIGDAMSEHFVALRASHDLDAARSALAEAGLPALLLLDEADRLVGGVLAEELQAQHGDLAHGDAQDGARPDGDAA